MAQQLYVTIGRQFGSGGREIGKKVAQALGIPYYDKELLKVAAEKSGLSHEFLSNYDEKPTNSFLYSLVMGQQNVLSGMRGTTVEQLASQAQRDAVLSVAEQGSCVIVGRCADYILRDREDVLNVFIHAPIPYRADRVVRLYGESDLSPEKRLEEKDKRRRAYYKHYANRDWGMSQNYHLSLDSSLVGVERCAQLILDVARNPGQ